MNDQLLSDKTVRAKKAHVCEHCQKSIEPGQLYKSSAMIWEGEFSVFRSHIDCDMAARHIHRVAQMNWDEGVLLHEDLEEGGDEAVKWLADNHPGPSMRMEIVLTPYF